MRLSGKPCSQIRGASTEPVSASRTMGRQISKAISNFPRRWAFFFDGWAETGAGAGEGDEGAGVRRAVLMSRPSCSAQRRARFITSNLANFRIRILREEESEQLFFPNGFFNLIATLHYRKRQQKKTEPTEENRRTSRPALATLEKPVTIHDGRGQMAWTFWEIMIMSRAFSGPREPVPVALLERRFLSPVRSKNFIKPTGIVYSVPQVDLPFPVKPQNRQMIVEPYLPEAEGKSRGVRVAGARGW